jgi:glycerate kinase
LDHLARVSRPTRSRWFKELIVAVDVQNPLLGIRGATRVYGPQKGLQKGDFAKAEKCLRALAEAADKFVVPPSGGPDRLKPELQTIPGAGAAGGLGFGLMAFAGANMEPGFELFARIAKLEKRLRAADLVITGEGCIDDSTFMGKGVGEIARRCRKHKIPSVALAGNITAHAAANRFFTAARALVEMTTVARAGTDPESWLKRLTEQMASESKFRTRAA